MRRRFPGSSALRASTPGLKSDDPFGASPLRDRHAVAAGLGSVDRIAQRQGISLLCFKAQMRHPCMTCSSLSGIPRQVSPNDGLTKKGVIGQPISDLLKPLRLSPRTNTGIRNLPEGPTSETCLRGHIAGNRLLHPPLSCSPAEVEVRHEEEYFSYICLKEIY